MKVELSDWAWLSLNEYPEEKLPRLQRKLTVQPRRTSEHQDDIIPPIRLYQIEGGRIGIPRGFFDQSKTREYEIVNKMSTGDAVKDGVVFAGELRPEQEAAVSTCYEDYKRGGLGGVIMAPPGTGKTVMGIALWLRMKRKCVVVVQKSFLVDQWKERIKQFAPEARVGIIQQDRCEYGDDYDISIAMIQSLAKRKDKYPKDMWKYFGLVISDEVHRISSPTWCRVVPRFTARYRCGLSATPKRKDRTENVFFWHIGKIIHRFRAKRVEPKLRRIFTKTKFTVTPRFNPNEHSKEIQIRYLCAMKSRNRLIVNELHKASGHDRKIIVLSERRKHLDTLKVMFDLKKPKECVTDYYVGGRTKQELKEAEKADVLFCTYHMAKEALDIPRLDTLFLVTPMADVEQAVGRIMRDEEGKKQPIVTDFIDSEIPRFEKLWRSRKRFYQKEGMYPKENSK